MHSRSRAGQCARYRCSGCCTYQQRASRCVGGTHCCCCDALLAAASRSKASSHTIPSKRCAHPCCSRTPLPPHITASCCIGTTPLPLPDELASHAANTGPKLRQLQAVHAREGITYDGAPTNAPTHHRPRELYSSEHVRRLLAWEARTPWTGSKCSTYCNQQHVQPCTACTTCHFCRCCKPCLQKTVAASLPLSRAHAGKRRPTAKPPAPNAVAATGAPPACTNVPAKTSVRRRTRRRADTNKLPAEVMQPDGTMRPGWTCPVCLDLCNCSAVSCLRAQRGWRPTGQLYSEARACGYTSVRSCENHMMRLNRTMEHMEHA